MKKHVLDSTVEEHLLPPPSGDSAPSRQLLGFQACQGSLFPATTKTVKQNIVIKHVAEAERSQLRNAEHWRETHRRHKKETCSVAKEAAPIIMSIASNRFNPPQLRWTISPC